MSNPKTDDGNRLMNKCYGNYLCSSSQTQHTCENPEVLEPIQCPVDRNGQPIYTCFNMSGDQDVTCQSTCLHGHPQDFSRTLYNKQMAGPYPLYWEERGVELYENFGLSEVVRGGTGSYTTGPDKNETDYQYGSYCSGSGENGGKWPNCRNTCYTQLGRKLTLFGQVGIRMFEDWSGLSVTDDPGGGFVLPSGYGSTFMASSGNYHYLVNFYRTAPNQTSDYVDQYDYFGNSGVVFKDANGKQYYFLYGIDPFIMNNGDKSYPTTQMLSHLLYDPSNRSLLVSIKYFNENANVVGLLCDAIPEVVVQKPGNCTRLSNDDGMNSPAIPFPFPGNLNAQIYCDVGYATNNHRLSTAPNCYYSGTRSMYVPPHMKVTGFQHMEYANQNKTWSSDYGAVQYNLVTKTGFKPFTYLDSPYKNGTFPSLGGVKANSPYDESTSGDQYSAGVVSKGGSYTNPVIYNCSLAGIWVDVRRDGQFRAKYIPSKYYNSNYLFPEMFLVPGVENAATFQSNTTSTFHVTDPIQSIIDPAQLWSASNPYWQSSQIVELDLTKSVYDALPVPVAVTTQSMIAELPRRFIHPSDVNLRKIMKVVSEVANMAGKGLELPIKMHNRAMQLNAISYSGKPYIGTGRIKSFVPINGVMSIEWLYVIYRCAFSYQPEQVNSITYNSDTKNYAFTDNTSVCGAECMLYRDPFYNNNPGAQTVSASDMMMKTICGMKTYTMAYAQYSIPTANDCACVAAEGYCPSLYNSNCSPSYTGQDQHYISDQASNENCDGTCGYCKTTVVQINLSQQNSNLTDGVNSNTLGPSCTSSSTCTFDSTGDTTSQTGSGTSGTPPTVTTPPTDPAPPPPPDTTSDKKNWDMVIFFVIMLILIIVVVIIVVVWYFKSP